MSRKPRARIDPLERAVEATLAPGRYVSYGASFNSVRGLGQVESSNGSS